MSQKADQLLELVKEIYPNQKIVTEHCIGNRLKLDIYLPTLSLAFEYDGKQHAEFVRFFHENQEGFQKAKQRDWEKEDICHEKNITLIRITHEEPLTKDHLQDRILEALS